MNQLVLSAVSSAQEWREIREQADTLVRSGLLPKTINTPEKAIVIMQKGKELGIPPMHAFSHIHIIDGKPTMSAELMLTMIVKNCPDARIAYLQNDGEACRLEASRKAMGKSTFGFSRADANQAGLMNKDNWRKYTRAMLRSRAISEMGRSMFPDALCGISYTPEEIGGEVEVAESGEIVVVEAKAATTTLVDEDKSLRKFVDSPTAWAWLEEKIFERHCLSEDCRWPIRDVAVGKTVRELDQLAYIAALGQDQN